jgi:hypothetical protein
MIERGRVISYSGIGAAPNPALDLTEAAIRAFGFATSHRSPRPVSSIIRAAAGP